MMDNNVGVVVERVHDAEMIEEMVRLVNTDWKVNEDLAIEPGRHHIHRLGVETGGGKKKIILKIPDDDREYSTEARVLSILNRHTKLPVPRVLGVVDEHDELPTPFFLMESLQGEMIHKTEIGSISEKSIRKIAVSSGKYLADLHRLDGVDSFGVITPEKKRSLRGSVPSGDIGSVKVEEGDKLWVTHVEDSLIGLIDEVSIPGFESLVSSTRDEANKLISDLSEDGPFEPVVGRVENSLDNLLIDLEEGEVTGMLDWEFVSATTGANDLVMSEFWLSGGPWSLVTPSGKHQEEVRKGLVEGYLRRGEEKVVEEFRSHHDLYELVVYLRTAHLFDEIFDNLDVTQEEREGATDRLRNRIAGITDRS